MLTLNLTPIFKVRGIEKPYTFLVKAGLSPHSATSILNSKTRVFRLDHVELLCDILVCEPNDLLEWIPEKGKKYSENNPLLKLKQQPTDNKWQETLSTMTFKELREVTKTIVAKTEEKK
ncbi:MAG: helix-turn-helix transcriptional regulator [Bacteroidales bacterium]|nr:helix-turn-helix transcriptional regulator [Bacteroidales bacterium]